MRVLTTIILFSYPVIVHVSVYAGHLSWAVYILAVLFILPVPVSLYQSKKSTWLILLSLFFAGILLSLASTRAEILLFAQPVIVNTLVFLIFLSSLGQGSVPLVSRMAKIIRPDAPVEVIEYCRWITWMWVFFFLGMAIVSFLLPFYASIETWSWVTNVLTYILIAAMFVLEYFIRIIFMREFIDRTFLQFIRDLRRVNYRKVLQDWRS